MSEIDRKRKKERKGERKIKRPSEKGTFGNLFF